MNRITMKFRLFGVIVFYIGYRMREMLFICLKFSSGRKVAILSGVVLNPYIFQTIHRTETEIASFERGGLPLYKIPISISSPAWLTSYSHNFA
jgi:hypothetical protein